MGFKKSSRKSILLFISLSLCGLCVGCAGLPIGPIDTTEKQTKYERFGEYIIKAHIDGEAKDNLIIGLPSYNSNRGKIYIYKARVTPAIDIQATIEGENEGDRVGEFVFTGNLNGDKNDDLIIGIPSANFNKGKICIFYGKNMWGNYELNHADDIIEGENEGDRVGEFVFTGNLNGDKKDDLIIGIPSANSNKGKICIFYGGNMMRNTSTYWADVIIEGEEEGKRVGENITIANFDTKDDIDDLVISVPTADGNKGKVYIFYGDSIPRFTTSVSNANLTIQ